MELEIVTFKDVIDGYQPKGDYYGLASYALAEPRKTAFLSNPFLTDTSKAMLLLAREDGKIVGRNMYIPSKVKVGEEIIDTVSGSALMVADDYRSSDAGIMLMSYMMQHREYNATVVSVFSRVAAKCHKAIGSKMLTFSRLIQIRSIRKMLYMTGVPSLLSYPLGLLSSILYYPFRYYTFLKGKKLIGRDRVEKVARVPEWVDEIVLNDGHQYMEVHDHKWLQWNLDNQFHEHCSNDTRFYTVSSFDGVNIGFFMIKERYEKLNVSSKQSLLMGSVVEWGTRMSELLDEYTLHLMALYSFSKKVDLVFMASADNSVVKRLKKHFILQKGEAEVAFKDMTKRFKDAKDKNLWRLRYGYADTILG